MIDALYTQIHACSTIHISVQLNIFQIAGQLFGKCNKRRRVKQKSNLMKEMPSMYINILCKSTVRPLLVLVGWNANYSFLIG